MSSGFSIAPFNGDKKNYWTSVWQLNFMFLAEHLKYDMHEKKILFTLNQMKGRYAEEWANMVMERYIMDSTMLTTWDAFKSRLDVKFADVVEKESMYLELMKLQKKGSSVLEFFTQFDYLVGKAGLTEDRHNDLLITILEPTLNYVITDWIYARAKLPVRYQDWKRKAIDIGGMLQRRNAVRPPHPVYMAPKLPEHRPPLHPT